MAYIFTGDTYALKGLQIFALSQEIVTCCCWLSAKLRPSGNINSNSEKKWTDINESWVKWGLILVINSED